MRFFSLLFARSGRSNRYMQISRKEVMVSLKIRRYDYRDRVLSRFFIIERLSRAQGRTIVRTSSTSSTGRRFISRRGLLHGLVVSGALRNGVKGTGE